MTGNVLDFTSAKLERDSVEGLTEIMETCIREAVEQIALIHGGMPDDWIDRKTEVATAIMHAMVETSQTGVKFSAPGSLSPQDQAQLERDIFVAVTERDRGFMEAFTSGLVELLGP